LTAGSMEDKWRPSLTEGAGVSARPALKPYARVEAIVAALCTGLAAYAVMGPLPPAYASKMEITPIPVNLSPQRPTQILTLRNKENAPLRMEFSVEAWDQGPDGTYKLIPTDDIVFFPELVEVPPQESAIV